MTKRIALIVLSFVLIAVLAIGGSVAYLTDVKEDVNVMVMGDIKIEQHEYERVVDENGKWVQLLDEDGNPVVDKYGYTPDKLQEFTQHKPLYPAVYNDGTGNVMWDDRNGSQAPSGEGSHQQSWFEVGSSGSDQLFDDSVKNVTDKFVMVENTGASDAYFRTLIAIECPEGVDAGLIHVNRTTSSKYQWSPSIYITIDGVRYVLLVATYQEALGWNQTARPSFLQAFLDPAATMADIEKFNGTMEIIVMTQAVQTEGFSGPAAALTAAFGVIDEDDHPWSEGKLYSTVPEVVYDDAGVNGVMEITEDLHLGNDSLFYAASGGNTMGDIVAEVGNVVINGNGNTVTMVATSLDAYMNWETGYKAPEMVNIFASANGTVTVNDLTLEGTINSNTLGWYATPAGGKNVMNNVNIVDTRVVSFSQVATALCIYGEAELNNCNIYGTTMSAADVAEFPLYDLAVVNDTVTTINGGKIGTIITWAHANLVINGAEVDAIYARTMQSKRNGAVIVESGSKVGLIQMINIDTYKPSLTVKAGATVDTIDLLEITKDIEIVLEAGATVSSILVDETTTFTSVDEFNAWVAEQTAETPAA